MPIPDYLRPALDLSTNTPDHVNLNRLWQLLEFATEKVLDDGDESSKEELASIWLQSSLLIMQFHNNYVINTLEIETMGKLLSNADSVKRVASQFDNARVLAFVCLGAIARTIAGERIRGRKEIGDILAAWTGDKTASSQSLSVENAANMLYGPAAYALYRTDVADDEELTALLCRENVAVISGKKNSELGTTTASMADMTTLMFNLEQP